MKTEIRIYTKLESLKNIRNNSLQDVIIEEINIRFIQGVMITNPNPEQQKILTQAEMRLKSAQAYLSTVDRLIEEEHKKHNPKVVIS